MRVLDNFATGARANLAGLPPELLTVTEGDGRDARVLAEVMPRGGTVFHLACRGVRHALHAPRENHEVNATGTLTVLEAARAAGVARFVHVASSEVYGPARTAPLSEEHPTFPTTVYGAAKLAGESDARAAFATHGFPARPPSTKSPPPPALAHRADDLMSTAARAVTANRLSPPTGAEALGSASRCSGFFGKRLRDFKRAAFPAGRRGRGSCAG